ncbi:MAG: lysine--tRNA ligase, partial [Candidatus Woesebacteria bacterium]|nr:lysine--tRNA ligase [Candidatus Woesebacteria bacterium]
LLEFGVKAEFLSSWDLYHQGKFDEVIKLALDNSEKIQNIYQKVSGSAKKEAGWLPFQVICEKCGKLGTTKVFAWDGEKVSYKCEPNLVTWAKGCGYEGKVSPFGGTGKLPWKVDWAAHWKVIGVTIEGAGKDHASAGGSYDIAMALCDDVFHYSKPYKLPYEHFLIGGKKMSSSKGLGLKARDWTSIVPASVGKFLFVRTDYTEALNFNPLATMVIPDLFDEYDRAWQSYIKGSDETLARIFELSQIDELPDKKKIFLPRFRDIANYLSQGLTEDEIVKKMPGAGAGILEERVEYAKVWLENYAPDDYKFEMTDEIPEDAKKLSSGQKEYLGEVAKLFEKDIDAGSLQVSLYNLSKQLKINSKEAFAAIYLAFIGKTHGPRAGLLLFNIGKDKVLKRLKEVINT